jgi:ABC-type nitrate/sulfonate/bicarbonate transport system substrate-binding protein
MKSHMPRIVTALAVAATLVFFTLRFLAPQSTPVEITTLSLGYRPGVAVDLALLNSIKSGEMLKAGLKVELKPYGRADLIFSAMESGEIQGSLGVPLEPVLEQAAKGKYPVDAFLVWYFTSNREYDGFITLASSTIKTVDDIGSSPIGSHPSKQVTSFVKSMVPGADIRPYNPVSPFTALDSRDVVAIYALEPFISLAKSNPKYRVIETSSISKRVFKGERIPAAVSMLSSTWASANSDEAKRFVAAAQSSFTAASNTPHQKLTGILLKPEFGGLSEGVAATVVEPFGSLPSELQQSEFDKFIEYLRTNGVLEGQEKIDLNRIMGSF